MPVCQAAGRRQVPLADRLRRLLRQAKDALYGSKSERLSKLPPEQLALALEDIEQAIAKDEAAKEKTAPIPDTARTRRKTNRGALPAHLPRLHETIAPADTDCPCCRVPMHVIGEETAERLDVIPAHYRVIVTHRPKLAYPASSLNHNSLGRGIPSDSIRGDDALASNLTTHVDALWTAVRRPHYLR
jgi:hypothetical protein